MSKDLRRIVLIIAYDGTNYAGWQRQSNIITIQEALEKSLFKIASEHITVMGSGRTDAGVHASAQVATFNCINSAIPADRFTYALNKVLSKDIRITRSFEISLNFDARRCANRRIYHYRFSHQNNISPVNRFSIASFNYAINFIKLNQLALIFVGYHDFSAFCSSKDSNQDKRRFVYRSYFTMENNLFVYHIEGNAFLMNMVRLIVGSILFLQEKTDAHKIIKQAILTGDKRLIGPKVQACGLTLEAIIYNDEWSKYGL